MTIGEAAVETFDKFRVRVHSDDPRQREAYEEFRNFVLSGNEEPGNVYLPPLMNFAAAVVAAGGDNFLQRFIANVMQMSAIAAAKEVAA